MEEIIFEITKQEKILKDFPIDIIRKFPVYSDHLIEETKSIIKYIYDPTNKLNKEEYTEYLKKYLIQKFNNVSISTTVKLLN